MTADPIPSRKPGGGKDNDAYRYTDASNQGGDGSGL